MSDATFADRCIGLLQKEDTYILYFGRFLLSLIFLMVAMQGPAANIQQLKHNQFVPLPAFSGVMGWLMALVGGLCSLIAYNSFVSIVGAKILIVFLVGATLFGHYKPMQQSLGQERMGHFLNIMKNLGLIGAMIMIIGYELPTCTLPDALSSFGAYLAWWQSHTVILLILGRFLLSMIFLIVASGGPAAKIEQMKGMGVPVPAVSGACGWLMSLSGGLCILIAYNPPMSIAGASILICFLIGATFFGHFLPFQKAEANSMAKILQMIACLKNASTMGAMVLIIGYELPMMPATHSMNLV